VSDPIGLASPVQSLPFLGKYQRFFGVPLFHRGQPTMPEPLPLRPDSDRNLLFGVLALQADLLDATRFAEACSAWAARKDTPLASLLVERGWLSPEDRDGVEQFLERKLKKHAGDVQGSLAEVLSEPMRQSLAGIADPDVCHTLSGVASADGDHEKATVNYQPVGRDRYTLTRLHAQGGIGQVWLARDSDLGRDVALKVLLASSSDHPVVVARFGVLHRDLKPQNVVLGPKASTKSLDRRLSISARRFTPPGCLDVQGRFPAMLGQGGHPGTFPRSVVSLLGEVRAVTGTPDRKKQSLAGERGREARRKWRVSPEQGNSFRSQLARAVAMCVEAGRQAELVSGWGAGGRRQGRNEQN
jgi:hypothetical protein